MGILYNRNIRTSFIILLLIITAVFLHQIIKYTDSLLIYQGAGLLRVLIYFGLFIAWGISIQQRIIKRQIRYYLIFITCLMAYWIMARTMRYFFVIEDPNFYHILWYSYYIPILLIPLLALFMVLYIGKPENYQLPKWLHLLYIPTILLIILVLTNGWHQQVFAFHPGDIWIRRDYEYGIGYWLIFAWMLICAVPMFAILISKSRVPRSKKILWLPIIPFVIYIVYAILYKIRVPFIQNVIGDMTAVFCLLIMAILESCIQIGLIRSNANYAGLFYASGIAAQIVDKNYKVHYRSEEAYPLPVETMRQAEQGLVELDPDTRLSSVPVTGGYALWIEDVSEMNSLLSELQAVGQGLAEHNDLLQAELELKECQVIIDEKNRIYDKVTKEAAPQLSMLNNLLMKKSPVAMPLREKLTWLTILGAYIKRRSNLIILSEDRNILYAKELEFCFRESIEAISECGIPSFFKRRCEGNLPTEYGFLVYDFFEEIIETTLPTLGSLLVNLNITSQFLELKLQLDCATISTAIKDLNKYAQLNQLCDISMEVTDGNLSIALHLPFGGVSG